METRNLSDKDDCEAPSPKTFQHLAGHATPVTPFSSSFRTSAAMRKESGNDRNDMVLNNLRVFEVRNDYR